MKQCAALLLAAMMAAFVFSGCRDAGGMTGRDYGNVSRTDDGEVNGTNAPDGTDGELFGDADRRETAPRSSDDRIGTRNGTSGSTTNGTPGRNEYGTFGGSGAYGGNGSGTGMAAGSSRGSGSDGLG